MGVIKIEADWHLELNANHKVGYVSIVCYIFAIGGSQPNMQIKRHWWISLGVYVVAENPTILLIFYQALFRFAAAMECINLADQIAYHQKVGNNKREDMIDMLSYK